MYTQICMNKKNIDEHSKNKQHMGFSSHLFLPWTWPKNNDKCSSILNQHVSTPAWLAHGIEMSHLQHFFLGQHLHTQLAVASQAKGWKMLRPINVVPVTANPGAPPGEWETVGNPTRSKGDCKVFTLWLLNRAMDVICRTNIYTF